MGLELYVEELMVLCVGFNLRIQGLCQRGFALCRQTPATPSELFAPKGGGGHVRGGGGGHGSNENL